jgi:membrane protease YdiL (CAAX protease family)
MPFGRPDRQPPDPGTPFTRTVALIAAVVATLAVVAIQNIPPLVEFFGPPPQQAEAATPEPRAITPPLTGDPFTTLGRLFVKMSDLVRQDPSALPTLDRFATGDADRLRAAIVAGELADDEAAAQRLADLLGKLDPADPLAQDAADLLPVYTPPGDDGEAAEGAPVPPAIAARLREHHGFFAEVALTHHLPPDNPERAALLTGGATMIAVMMTALGVGALAVLVGVVLFVVAVVQASRGKMRAALVPPEPGGSVYLEVFALFVGGFLLLKGVTTLLAMAFPTATWLGAAAIVLQWGLLAVVFWPRLRGMSGERFAGTIGWHTGRGFWREVGWGVLGYLAGLPVYLAGLALTVLALFIATLVRGLSSGGEPPLPSETIFEIIGSSPPLELVLFFSLAVLWAPLCEESVFRGALYRHFRGRWGVAAAALGSATLFGFMHGYGPLFVFPLIALGTVFAVMREWRGSLIAPMTAHFLHNGTVTVLLLVMLRVLA